MSTRRTTSQEQVIKISIAVSKRKKDFEGLTSDQGIEEIYKMSGYRIAKSTYQSIMKSLGIKIGVSRKNGVNSVSLAERLDRIEAFLAKRLKYKVKEDDDEDNNDDELGLSL